MAINARVRFFYHIPVIKKYIIWFSGTFENTPLNPAFYRFGVFDPMQAVMTGEQYETQTSRQWKLWVPIIPFGTARRLMSVAAFRHDRYGWCSVWPYRFIQYDYEQMERWKKELEASQHKISTSAWRKQQ